MFDFIANTFRTVLGFITGSWQAALTSVIGFVRDTFTAFHGYWHTVASNSINAWQVFTRDTLLFIQALQRFMLAQYAANVLIIKRLIPNVVTAITALSRKEAKDIQDTIKVLRHDIAAGDAKEHSYARGILVWVVLHVLLFLFNILRTAVTWIASRGDSMWHYFTHLDEFALLLFWHIITSLETLAWDAGARLGKFFLSLIVHNLTRFVTLVESIVDAIL
jgi:hypothetical protein